MLGHKLVQGLSVHFDVYTTLRGSFDQVEKFGIFDRSKVVAELDVTNVQALENAISKVRPDVVINAIGIVKQVPSAKDVIATIEINSLLPHRLAEFGLKYGFRLITVSTDCVFDGVRGFYSESDVPNAVDLYGKSKNLGEPAGENCLTIRTSIIGRELNTSHSLIEWFLSNRGGRVSGYTTAIYSGFPTVVFADIILSLITDRPNLSGLYHVAAEPINKFELLGLVNEYFDAGISVTPSEELKIDRSLDAGKFNSVTGFRPLPWNEMVKRMAADSAWYDEMRK